VEILLLLAIAAALAFILGISTNLILTVVLAVLLILSLLTTILFIICFIVLLLGKKKSATFIETVLSERKILYAFYSIGDSIKIRNLFPADSLTKHLLNKHKNETTSVRIVALGKRRFCFDKYASTTIFLGLPLFVLQSATLLFVLSLCI